MRLVTALLLALALPVAAGSQELTGTLRKIKETGKVVVGFQEASVPFSYLDDRQNAVGFAVDICARVVDAVRQRLGDPGIKAEMAPVTSGTRIPLMVNGTIDLVCSATTNNAERQKQVAFTNTHFLTATRFASRKAAGFKSVDDLKGRSVVAVAGSVNLVQVNAANTARKLGMNVIGAKDQAEAFLLLETDRAAAYFVDDIQLAVAIAGSKDPGAFVVSEDALSRPEPLGIMLRRDDPPFKALVDRATADLYRSPEIATLYGRWFEQPVPPRGLNFRTPMSAALRRSFANPSDNPDPAAYE